MASLVSTAVMMALEEHVEKYKTPAEISKKSAEVKVTAKHFDDALAKMKPSSQEEKRIYSKDPRFA